MSIAAAAARGTRAWGIADTLFVDDGSRRGDEVRTAMLRLDFDYGGRRVRAVDPRPSSLRDPAAEACRVLEAPGLRLPLGAAPLGRHDVEQDNRMPALARWAAMPELSRRRRTPPRGRAAMRPT